MKNNIYINFIIILFFITKIGASTGLKGEFEYNQSVLQAFYFFINVNIDGVPIESEDWVGAFINRNGVDICVGSKRWNTSLCGNGICEVPIMGNDDSEWTVGYLQIGEVPFFKIFDISERVIYNASSGDDVAWSVNNLPIISNLSNTTIDTDIPALHQFNGSITASVYFDGSVEEEDYLIAFINNETRGIVTGNTFPGTGEVVFLLMIYNNQPSGEMISFYFHDASEITNYEIDSHIEFISNMTEGDGFNPVPLGHDLGIPGCMDEVACNFSQIATVNDGSCIYESDCLGICGGSAVLDECGICNGGGIDEGACDCDGNILDECGICNGGGIDEGACDCEGNVEDCAGECNGTSIIDECGLCGGNGLNNLGCGCFQPAPDDCGICGGDASDECTMEDCLGTCPDWSNFSQSLSTESCAWFVNLSGDSCLVDTFECNTLIDLAMFYCESCLNSGSCDDNCNYFDCEGVCEGDAEFDCEGICNGDAVVDVCGECNGSIIDVEECLSIESSNIPNENLILQAYPNPFNPNVNIKIFIEHSNQISINIYDLSGKKIDTIYDGFLTRGYHDYIWNAQNFNSGVYFIHLLTLSNKSITKVNLIK